MLAMNRQRKDLCHKIYWYTKRVKKWYIINIPWMKKDGEMNLSSRSLETLKIIVVENKCDDDNWVVMNHTVVSTLKVKGDIK